MKNQQYNKPTIISHRGNLNGPTNNLTENKPETIEHVLSLGTSGKTTNGEFYVCPVYNFMIKDQGSYVSKYDIETSDMFGLGTPEDLERFLNEQPTI